MEVYGKEAAGLVLEREQFTDLLSAPEPGDIQTILVPLSSGRSLLPVETPGNWDNWPVRRFKG